MINIKDIPKKFIIDNLTPYQQHSIEEKYFIHSTLKVNKKEKFNDKELKIMSDKLNQSPYTIYYKLLRIKK